MDEWTMTLTVRNRYGRECFSVAVNLHYGTMISERTVDDVKTPSLSMMNFDDVVRVMKVKGYRRKEFIAEAERLGHQLAAYIEDREGWHGIDRKEAIAARERAEKA
jgi:hypothetical protein